MGVSQPRPRSPSLQQRSGTPPPASPIKRSTTPGATPYSPFPATSIPPVPSLARTASSRPDIEVDVVLLDGPTEATARLGQPFSLTYRVAVSGLLPPGGAPDLLGQQPGKKIRLISLAVQHISPDPNSSRPPLDPKSQVMAPSLKRHGSKLFSAEAAPTSPGIQSPSSHTGSIDMLTPRRVVSPPPGGPAAVITAPTITRTESSTVAPSMAQGDAALGGLEERLRRIALSEALGVSEDEGRTAFGEDDEDLAAAFNVRLPPPYRTVETKADEKNVRAKGSGIVRVLGSSAQFLPPIELRALPVGERDVPEPGARDRGEGSAMFTLTYYAKARGFAAIGGLRILLVKDEEKLVASDEDRDSATLHAQSNVQQSDATTLREWDVIAELWIR